MCIFMFICVGKECVSLTTRFVVSVGAASVGEARARHFGQGEHGHGGTLDLRGTPDYRKGGKLMFCESK